MSLHIYTVHVKPHDAAPHETAEFVREGFNWGAFLFTWMWAFYHRLWWVGAALLALDITCEVALREGLLSMGGVAVIKLGVQALLGFSANDLRRARLKRQEYVTADIVAGDGELAAEYRFFERWLAAEKPAAAGMA